MKIARHHSWNVTTRKAKAIQESLRCQVCHSNGPELKRLRTVAGVDVSVRDNRAIAAVPVLDFATLDVIEVAKSEQQVPFPYVPGLLSFRECPSILAAFRKLRVEPDLVLVDGQGIAHPRRCGLASHLGILLDKPTIGCAKSRYIGEHDEPHPESGYYTDLWDGDELIGAVLRTRLNVKPLYISVGHKVDLSTSLNLVLQCCNGYRLPEPIRMAHQAAGVQ